MLKIKELVKQRFWFSLILTLAGSMLAGLLGANTFWAVIAGLVVANIVNLWIFLRPSRNAGASEKPS